MLRVSNSTFLQSQSFVGSASGVLKHPPTVFSPSCLQQIQDLEQDRNLLAFAGLKTIQQQSSLAEQTPGAWKPGRPGGFGAGRALVLSSTKDTPQNGPPGTSLLWDFVSILCSTDTKIKIKGSELINGMRWNDEWQITHQSTTVETVPRGSPSFLSPAPCSACFGHRNIPIPCTQPPSNLKISWQEPPFQWISGRSLTPSLFWEGFLSCRTHTLPPWAWHNHTHHNNPSSLGLGPTWDEFRKLQTIPCLLCLCSHLARPQSGPAQKPHPPRLMQSRVN